MIPLIVACHGRFADELVKSAAMVYGEAESVHAVTFMPGEGPDDLLRKYEEIVAAEGSPEAVLLLVDLFGGSPYNAAVRLASAHEGMDVLSGVNLPMLLELLDSRDENSTVPQLVESAYNASREGTKTFRTSRLHRRSCLYLGRASGSTNTITARLASQQDDHITCRWFFTDNIFLRSRTDNRTQLHPLGNKAWMEILTDIGRC